MYFAVIGKNPEISKAELQLLHPQNISYPKKWIVMFETETPEFISQLWWIIKAGTVVKEKDLQTLLQDTKIIWIKEEANGKHLKRTMGIRRFKIVDIFHTDKEIKNKGKEIINLENGLYGIVEQYQNIELYETVDFSKPGRSMQMGMMPAKLTHMIINIWLQQHWPSTSIYDPFVGSWTTWFLANYLGYDFIGSDRDIQYIEKNLPWRKTTKFYNTTKQFEIFQQDITQPIPNWSIKKDTLIITEWRLWPIVTKTTPQQMIQKYQEQVGQLYKSFLEKIKELWVTMSVFTIPYYLEHNNFLQQKITEFGSKIGLNITEISELYMREWQQVARKILIIKNQKQ